MDRRTTNATSAGVGNPTRRRSRRAADPLSLRTGDPTNPTSRLRALFEDAGTRGWLHATRLPTRPTQDDYPSPNTPTTISAGPAAVSDVSAARAGGAGSSTATVGTPWNEVGVDPDALVPMASVYKLPLLVAFCALVDQGVLDPRQRLTLEPDERTPGPTGLSVLADPVSVSLRDLAVLMMTVSDNAAADALLDVVGLDRLADLLVRHGLTRTHVRRGTAGNLRDLLNRTRTNDPDAAFAVLADNDTTDPEGIYEAANASSTTARDMTTLLGLIWSGSLLSAEQTEFVRRAMGLQVFAHRLGSGFPHDAAKVFGKTGTFAALRHEVGVVELPDGSAYAVAVFTRAARGDRKLPRVDRAIGEAARLAVDHLR